jgi:hypothetical protein
LSWFILHANVAIDLCRAGKCASKFGTTYPAAVGVVANLKLEGMNYSVQV